MKRGRRAFPLKITPAEKGSGLSEMSENHDYYLALGLKTIWWEARTKGRQTYRTGSVPTIWYF